METENTNEVESTELTFNPNKTMETNEQAFNRIAEGLRRWKLSTTEAMYLIAEAHERKIWEPKCGSFKDFCEQECGITKQWGYTLLKTHKEILALTSGMEDQNTLEAAKSLTPAMTAELQSLPVREAQERAVWLAKESGEVTVKSIRNAVIQVHAERRERLEYLEGKIEEGLNTFQSIWEDALSIADEERETTGESRDEVFERFGDSKAWEFLQEFAQRGVIVFLERYEQSLSDEGIPDMTKLRDYVPQFKQIPMGTY